MEQFLGQIQKLFFEILQTSIEASIFIGILLVCKTILGKKLSAFWHYALWFLVLIKLTIPWLPAHPFSWNVSLPWPFEFHEHLAPSSSAGLGLESSSVSFNAGESTREFTDGFIEHQAILHPLTPMNLDQPASISTALLLALAVWLIGAVLMLLNTLRSYSQLNRRLAKEETLLPLEHSRIMKVYKHSLQTLGIHTRIELKITRQVSSPALFGLFKPTILLPSHLVGFMSDKELSHVLIHELTHFKSKDIAVNLWAASVLCLHWFNPLVWHALARMRADQELACDAAALKSIGYQHRNEYASSLLKILEIGAASSLISSRIKVNFFGYKKQIKRRILMIKSAAKYKRSSFIAGLSLALLLTILALPLAVSGEKEPAPEQESKILISNSELQFTLPTEGFVSRDFGWYQAHPKSDEKVFHNGVDIVNEEGTAIFAVADGIVTYADYDVEHGNSMIIKHNDTWESRYDHLSEIRVQEGASVHQGENIALMGSTGKSVGPHLHLTLLKNGEPVDPILFIENLSQLQIAER